VIAGAAVVVALWMWVLVGIATAPSLPGPPSSPPPTQPAVVIDAVRTALAAAAGTGRAAGLRRSHHRRD